eukprot:TRINITY_DN3820_c0_g1_i1.p1 TRINITY_DN3820_c0_g1~~TRINITY_DN3820_c0_g1_i1.p1  ORF type:complete len:381 (-),score=117.40 TRINITY_DN3820_c0_g1_i1:117-1259(-)
MCIRDRVSTQSTGWFLCLYLNSMPSESVLRVWDVFLSEGDKVLFRVGMALLKENERDIMALDEFSDIFDLIRKIPRKALNCESLLTVAFKDLGSFPMKKIEKHREHYTMIVLEELEDAEKRRQQHREKKLNIRRDPKKPSLRVTSSFIRSSSAGSPSSSYHPQINNSNGTTTEGNATICSSKHSNSVPNVTPHPSVSMQTTTTTSITIQADSADSLKSPINNGNGTANNLNPKESEERETVLTMRDFKRDQPRPLSNLSSSLSAATGKHYPSPVCLATSSSSSSPSITINTVVPPLISTPTKKGSQMPPDINAYNGLSIVEKEKDKSEKDHGQKSLSPRGSSKRKKRGMEGTRARVRSSFFDNTLLGQVRDKEREKQKEK